ncbi:hypothetical protein NP233_g1108 [Leucocoprinus birnbaumii]|uniref:Chromo domain-containing protein n=1 Tax=Leucocoprinus birnbaumii TaxID=56174 RepID=A0AAD5YV53_9AGAR|nr:hypothetical protein NP233_g1108 [Leucocoprinus birnbaumii]
MDTESEVSSIEHQFSEREDDDETLWEVEEIVGEKGKKYRVRWSGVDEKGKPWPLDWVLKEDCTPTLVKAWKAKQAEAKKKKKSTRPKSVRSRASITSTTTKVSLASSSSTVTQQVVSRPKHAASGSKRKIDQRDRESISDAVQSESESIRSSRPKKKRKVVVEIASPKVSSTSKPPKKAEASVQSSTRKYRLSYETTSEDEVPQVQQPKSRQTALSPVNRKKVNSTSKSTSKAPKRKRPASEVELSESDAPTARVPSKPQGTASKKKATGSFRNGRVQSTKHPSTKTGPVARHSPSPSVSGISEPPAPKKVAAQPSTRASSRSSRGASPLFLPASPQSISIPVDTTKKHSVNERLDVGLFNAGVGRGDEDSALEYADYPMDEPHPASSPPPPAQPQHTPRPVRSPSISFVSPPPISLLTPKGKARAVESEVVPETEAEDSQESHQRDVDAHIALVRSASKNSLKSRMRPRTPGSKRNIPDADVMASPLPFENSRSISPQPRTKKPLRPIPQISPSTFTNLSQSAIESTQTTDGGVEDDTIDEFTSPDKSRRRKDAKPSQETDSSLDASLPVPLAATDVAKKGAALAEAARRAKQSRIFTQAKLSLATIIGKEKVRFSRVPPISEDETDEPEPERKATSPSTLEEFEDSFVDYNGGAGVGTGDAPEAGSKTQETSKNDGSAVQEVQKVFARQEEEENTQDLLEEVHQQQQQQQRPVPDAEEGWAYPDGVPPSQVPVSTGSEEIDIACDSLEVAPPKSSAPLPETSQEESIRHDPLTQPSAVEPTPSLPLDSSLVVPATLPPTHPQQDTVAPSQLDALIHDVNVNDQHLDSAMNLLNKKSEEITRLESLLANARSVIEGFETETTNRIEEKSKLIEENTSLQQTLQTLRSRAEFAEKSAEIFREQYARVSGYAEDLQSENKELSERAEIAENQANNGLAGIKMMYEMRVKKLQEEAEYQKSVTLFLIEQGKRTQDEEIRRRAGEYPELERQCEELRDELRKAEEMLDG